MPEYNNRRHDRRLPDFVNHMPGNLDEERHSSPVPTFSGAVEWLTRHQTYINTTVKLLQTYPNLVKDKSLDSLWLFLEPFVQRCSLLQEYETYITNQFNGVDNFKIGQSLNDPIPTPIAWLKNQGGPSNEVTHHKNMYFCFSHNGGIQTTTAVDNITRSLLPFCHVRCNPHSELMNLEPKIVCQSIKNSHIFVFLLSDESIADSNCLHLLSLALSYEVPIFMIRQPGFELPDPLPEHVIKLETKIIDIDDLRPKTALSYRSATPSSPVRSRSRTSRSRRGAGSPVPRAPLSRRSSSNTVTDSIDESDGEDGKKISLANVITEGCLDAFVYTSDFHESCMAKLYGKLSDYLGEHFLEIEVIQSQQERNLRVQENRNQNIDKSLEGEHDSPDERCLSRDSGLAQTNYDHSVVSGDDIKDKEQVDHQNTDINVSKNDDHHSLQGSDLNSNGDSESKKQRPKSPIQRQTSYLVFPDSRNGSAPCSKPEVVKWPPEEEKLESRLASESESPTSFNHVNLALEYTSTVSTPENITRSPSPKLSEHIDKNEDIEQAVNT